MATSHGPGALESRQWTSSPRSKGRGTCHECFSSAEALIMNTIVALVVGIKLRDYIENAKNIICRNITIYGYCKHEKDGEGFGQSRPRQHEPLSNLETPPRLHL